MTPYHPFMPPPGQEANYADLASMGARPQANPRSPLMGGLRPDLFPQTPPPPGGFGPQAKPIQEVGPSQLGGPGGTYGQKPGGSMVGSYPGQMGGQMGKGQMAPPMSNRQPQFHQPGKSNVYPGGRPQFGNYLPQYGGFGMMGRR